MTLDLASQHLVAFGAVLRGARFAASTDQGISFLAGALALGPESLDDLRSAARATYGPAPERRGEFDALFDQHFLGRAEVSVAEEGSEESVPRAGAAEALEEGIEADRSGTTASAARVRVTRQFDPQDRDATLRRLARLAPSRLPVRQMRRFQSAYKGARIDRLRSLRAARRNDGEFLDLHRKTRRTKLRPILMLIDISGSMKSHTEDALRLAHQMMRLPTRVEVFSLGTDLTRLTRDLRPRDVSRSLDLITQRVQDFDGGTRLGETLQELLSRPNTASAARGAIVITLSDGLEIGTPDRLVHACERLHRLAFAHLWLTPLANRPGFVPETQALQRIAPFVDEFGSAASISAICAHLLGETQRTEGTK